MVDFLMTGGSRCSRYFRLFIVVGVICSKRQDLFLRVVLQKSVGIGLLRERHQFLPHRPPDVASDDVERLLSVDGGHGVVIRHVDIGDVRRLPGRPYFSGARLEGEEVLRSVEVEPSTVLSLHITPSQFGNRATNIPHTGHLSLAEGAGGAFSAAAAGATAQRESSTRKPANRFIVPSLHLSARYPRERVASGSGASPPSSLINHPVGLSDQLGLRPFRYLDDEAPL